MRCQYFQEISLIFVVGKLSIVVLLILNFAIDMGMAFKNQSWLLLYIFWGSFE